MRRCTTVLATAMVAAMATMASTALPPDARIIWPVSAASLWGAATAAVEKTGVSGILEIDATE